MSPSRAISMTGMPVSDEMMAEVHRTIGGWVCIDDDLLMIDTDGADPTFLDDEHDDEQEDDGDHRADGPGDAVEIEGLDRMIVGDLALGVFSIGDDLYVVADLPAPADETGDGATPPDPLTLAKTRTPYRVLTGYDGEEGARADMWRAATVHVLETGRASRIVGWGDDLVMLVRTDDWAVFQIARDDSIDAVQCSSASDATKAFNDMARELAHALETWRRDEFDEPALALLAASWIRQDAATALAQQTAHTSMLTLAQIAPEIDTPRSELARMLHTDTAAVTRRVKTAAVLARTLQTTGPSTEESQ